jgi:hypothetical protein
VRANLFVPPPFVNDLETVVFGGFAFVKMADAGVCNGVKALFLLSG